MQLKTEREVMFVSKKKRRDYIRKLENFKEKNPNAFSDFIVDVKGAGKYGWHCPCCDSMEEFVVNITDKEVFGDKEKWIEHCICRDCGKFYYEENGVG